MSSPLLTLVLLLVLAMITAIVGVLHALSTLLLRPPRMSDGKALYVLRRMSPGDLGLSFEAVDFRVADRASPRPLRIAAWWIAAAAPASRTAILVHGFADAKVGALAWAAAWRDLGWNLLLIDLRAHGESGGVDCTGGCHERDDLDAVIDQLLLLKPDATRQVALFGVSLGGAVVLATATRRDDIDAVVADSVFADYRQAAIAHGRLIGAPLPSLTPLAIRWAEYRAGVRFDTVRPVDTVIACRCPVMLIHGDVDPFVPANVIAALEQALRSRGNPRENSRDDHFVVTGAGHCMAIVADAPNYARRLDAFLSGCDGSTTRA